MHLALLLAAYTQVSLQDQICIIVECIFNEACESKIICVDPLVASEWHISSVFERERERTRKIILLISRKRNVEKEKTAHSDQFQ